MGTLHIKRPWIPGGVVHCRPVVFTVTSTLGALSFQVQSNSSADGGLFSPSVHFLWAGLLLGLASSTLSYQEGTKGTAGALGPSERACNPANPSLTKSFLWGQSEENVVIWATLPFYR